MYCRPGALTGLLVQQAARREQAVVRVLIVPLLGGVRGGFGHGIKFVEVHPEEESRSGERSQRNGLKKGCYLGLLQFRARTGRCDWKDTLQFLRACLPLQSY